MRAQPEAAAEQPEPAPPEAEAAVPEEWGEEWGEEIGLAPPRLAARLLAALACNAHTVCDEELRPIGVGVPMRQCTLTLLSHATRIPSFI